MSDLERLEQYLQQGMRVLQRDIPLEQLPDPDTGVPMLRLGAAPVLLVLRKEADDPHWSVYSSGGAADLDHPIFSFMSDNLAEVAIQALADYQLGRLMEALDPEIQAETARLEEAATAAV